MPSHERHEKYCRDKGIDLDACKFANKIIDEPEKVLPSLLEDEGLRKKLYEIFGFEWVYWFSVEMKNYWNVLSHGELHGTSKKISIEDIKKYRKMVEEIAAYFYGDEGRRAVKLHFELDEPDHALKEIRSILIQNIMDSVLYGRRFLPASSFIQKAISEAKEVKDANLLLRRVIETDRTLKNYRTFLVNVCKLIKEQSGVAPGKTFEQLINENKELEWLKPLIEEAKTSELKSGWAIYKCPSCHRRIAKPEGNYYCKICGPNTIMIKIKDLKIKDLTSHL